jgi:hypothetical protein
MTISKSQGNLWALGGVLFAAFFIIGGVLSGVLAPTPLPLPDAPATDVVRYYEASRAAALASGSLQVLSAVSLFVFVPCVVGLVRRARSEASSLPGLTLAGGVLAAALLLVSALLSLVLVPVVAGSNLALVGALRYLTFLTGGTLHVASLGLFVGAASIAALRAKTLPRWIQWLGIVAAALSLLSLASLVLFPASILIPLGRLLAFVWSIAVGIVLALGKQRETGAEL